VPQERERPAEDGDEVVPAEGEAPGATPEPIEPRSSEPTARRWPWRRLRRRARPERRPGERVEPPRAEEDVRGLEPAMPEPANELSESPQLPLTNPLPGDDLPSPSEAGQLEVAEPEPISPPQPEAVAPPAAEHNR